VSAESHNLVAGLELTGNAGAIVVQALDLHRLPYDVCGFAPDDPYARPFAPVIQRAERYLQVL
jgi:hypothetical protein